MLAAAIAYIHIPGRQWAVSQLHLQLNMPVTFQEVGSIFVHNIFQKVSLANSQLVMFKCMFI